jgi:hypothetical protein
VVVDIGRVLHLRGEAAGAATSCSEDRARNGATAARQMTRRRRPGMWRGSRRPHWRGWRARGARFLWRLLAEVAGADGGFGFGFNLGLGEERNEKGGGGGCGRFYRGG